MHKLLETSILFLNIRIQKRIIQKRLERFIWKLMDWMTLRRYVRSKIILWIERKYLYFSHKLDRMFNQDSMFIQGYHRMYVLLLYLHCLYRDCRFQIIIVNLWVYLILMYYSVLHLTPNYTRHVVRTVKWFLIAHSVVGRTYDAENRWRLG